MHRLHATETGAGHSAAVVGVLPADDDLFVRLAAATPVVTYHAHHRVVGLGAGSGIENVVQPVWGDFREHLGETYGRHVGGLEETVVVGQLLHLGIGRVCQFLAAVADIHAPQTGHAVENSIAVRIPEIDPLRAADNPGALVTELLVVGERVEVMRPVQGLEFGRAEVTLSVHASPTLVRISRPLTTVRLRRSAAGTLVPTG
jgi:hypothetical protein